MIIILINENKYHPKVPEVEQMLSTGAAAQKYFTFFGFSWLWSNMAYGDFRIK